MLPPGGVKLWALLSTTPQKPKVERIKGWKPGETLTLKLRQKGAPPLTCFRVEIHDRAGKSLPELATNLLVQNGSAVAILALPHNLPAGCKMTVQDVLTGNKLEIAIR